MAELPDVLWANLARFGVLALLALCVAAAARIVARFAAAARRGRGETQLMAWHIAAVSAAVLIPYGALAWALAESVSRPPTVPTVVRMVMYAIGAGLFLASMWLIGRVQTARRTSSSPPR